MLTALQTAVIHEISGLRRGHRCERLLPAKRRLCRGRVADLGEVPGWSGSLRPSTSGDNLDEASKASFVEATRSSSFDDEGLTVYGTVDAGSSDSVVAAEIVYGVVDDSDDSVIFIGEEPASFEALDDGSGQVAAFYDLTVLTLSDGIDTDFAYLDMEIDYESGLWFLDVPLWYVPPEEADTDDPPTTSSLDSR